MSQLKHATAAFAEIAEEGTILRTRVGSEVHGVSLTAQADRDEMGVCVEPPDHVIGLGSFEQYVFRTQPEGSRSGPGDLDLVVYSLRKWMRLALEGNPTVILPLFVADSEVVRITRLGEELRARPELVLSREVAHRFLGYLSAQRLGLLGERGARVNRPELVERHGFDTKFAYHMVRVGLQGVELLETGRITLPVARPWRDRLLRLRRGELDREFALEAAAELEARLRELATASPLPERPDRDRANRWLVRAYQSVWEEKGWL
ncbi:nucleotidyltransferase domain-containing protein [Streptoalloteichus hindustanus]|uniref:Predicted nucleotidyltransferase n=1 Tax=Streptoalloteichus hindustanus TaxID=2017 RepID=A0A1M4TBL9_STRHI|nr:nucleotidyltransferase domain-containing protein [Streptoalloteichus hindustanus]SHE41805.1 Predicted nucleotidyltransferase [Streptoalloteichus hindustanus]